jgi:rSAM/selenodomain-associated transferase 2
MKISIIIPVLGEENIINDTLSSLEKIRGGRDLEIIVVDGSREKETIRAVTPPLSAILGDFQLSLLSAFNFKLSAFAPKASTLTLASSPKGLSVQMNRGASLATGDILLFLHADTVLPYNAFAKIESLLARDKCSAGAFSLGIDSSSPLLKVIAFFANIRTRFTGIPYGDQAIFIRKDLFDQLGGYREIPIMQDVDLIKRIGKAGKRISVLREKAFTSPRRWHRNGIIFNTLKNHAIRILYSLGIPEKTLAALYY